ncbi:MAG: barstar family protein [Jiangellaceae bacterium]|nr:barstar family protein [Jiangellaceae bacterium]
MSGLAALLAGRRPPGVYLWQSHAAASDVQHATEKARWTPFCVDGRNAAVKSEVLARIAATCGFPEQPAADWAALADGLMDLSWAPAERGYLLFYDGWGMLAWTEPQSWREARAVFDGVCARWSGTPTPMAVLLRGPGPVDDLPDLR